MGYFRTLTNAILGRPVALSNSGYYAASNGRRTVNIGRTTRGASSLALAEAPQMLAMARKADMDNPLARGGIGAFVSEVIGTGIRPHSKHSNPDVRMLLEKEFALWVPQSSSVRRIGPGGKPDSLQDFWTQQSLVGRNLVVAGEAFARLRPRYAADLSPSGLRVPLQIQLIEPEQLAHWRTSCDGMLSGNIMRGGIEFDVLHQRVAYAFYREHPGDASLWPNAWEVVRVPAESVLHVMEFLQGEQIRGISGLAPILVALADLDDFEDAERLRQKLGAYLFAWKETNTPDNDPTLQSSAASVGTDQAPMGAAYVESQPGQVTILDTNLQEKFGFYAHPGVTNTYETFLRLQRQTIAVVTRVSYDMLTGDNSSTTFMNARVRLIALRRMWEQFQQQVIVHQFCRPVWRAWLDAAALAGVIDASDYRRNPEEYLNVEWSGQPWDWVDPIKDVESIRMEIEACLTSREAEVAKRARRVEEVDAEIARDHAREKSLGIVPVYGTSRVTEKAPAGDNAANDETASGDNAGTKGAGK